MPVNGTNSHSTEDSVTHQSRLLFERMERHVTRLSKELRHSDVHRFRTNGRRVEAILTEFSPETRNRKKLLKRLAKLRKQAGKVRDLDVQIAFLKELKLPDHRDQRLKMIHWLQEERARRARKLAKVFDSDLGGEIRKRLRRARAELKLDGIDPLFSAYAQLPRPGNGPLNEKALHEFRIAAKRARYLAELGDTPPAKSFVEQLKRAQDGIGDWHDVLKLKEAAERHFGGAQDSALVAVLQNVARARFRQAVNSLLTALSSLEADRPAVPPRKALRDLSPAAPAQAAVA